jgi:hypothetical protein
MALLAPHLGCGAYPIRSGIVTAIGHLLHGAFEQGARDGADSQGEIPPRCLCSVACRMLSEPVLVVAYDAENG